MEDLEKRSVLVAYLSGLRELRKNKKHRKIETGKRFVPGDQL